MLSILSRQISYIPFTLRDQFAMSLFKLMDTTLIIIVIVLCAEYVRFS